MKILNIKNQQNEIQNLKDFADIQSINFILSLQIDDKQSLKKTCKQFQPIVNQIQAEVLCYELLEFQRVIDDPSTDLKYWIQKLMVSTVDVLEEIEKKTSIKYDRGQIEEAFYMVSMNKIIVDDRAINDACCDTCNIQ